ncbi:MAG: VCBS repeat-containing protein, partial [Draconibacterium sp.]|nr:VCBS repeat-containing protein [Draconibacterium sp.]
MKITFISLIIALFFSACKSDKNETDNLIRIEYNNPGLTVDLAVGLWAWPLPYDYDKDGDLDLLVSCPDKPYNGIWFFENPGGSKNPVFKPAVKISDAIKNIQISYVNNKPKILAPYVEYSDFVASGNWKQDSIYDDKNFDKEIVKIRADQWKYVDYENDGDIDIIVGRGEWGDYGWDNAFDSLGNWQNGPLHGYVYLIENVNDKYNKPVRIKAGGEDIDVFGMPTPNFADFDNDGDLDLICGEFLDGFNYFENIGTREKPVYANSQRLSNNGVEISMDLQMITPTSVDWDGDGDIDLIVGDEDGRVAFIENIGNIIEGVPQFKQPEYLKQQAEFVKFGALVTPVSVDWDNDGDEDIVCGSSAGYVGFIENLNGENPPKWAAPVKLKADGKTIRFQAGINGSIQGTAEAKWGYTTISVADWDGDGLNDLLANSIWGKVEWFRNTGSEKSPVLTFMGGVNIDWGAEPAKKPEWNWWNPEKGKFVTQWRTTPYAIDWNKDGMTDLVMLENE